MLNKKIQLLILAAFAMLAGCRITTNSFSGNKIDPPFFKKVTEIWGVPSISRIDSITVYKAILQEELVDRDGIPEYKLVNSESKQSRAGIVGMKNYHELYLCQLHTNKKSEKLCVFIATGFNVKNKCTKLGPAYLGVIRMEQINIKKELTITSGKDSSYFISGAASSNLLFIADKNIPPACEGFCNDANWNDSLCNIRISEIINSNINKIGGKKPTLYSIPKIFSDADALVFRYYKTLKP